MDSKHLIDERRIDSVQHSTRYSAAGYSGGSVMRMRRDEFGLGWKERHAVDLKEELAKLHDSDACVTDATQEKVGGGKGCVVSCVVLVV